MANGISGTNNDIKGKGSCLRDDLVSSPESKNLDSSDRSSETSEKSPSSCELSATRPASNLKINQHESDSSLYHTKNHIAHHGSALWYRESKSLGLGDVNRYTIKYTVANGSNAGYFYFRLKNMEKTGLRAIHLVNGPFILYCHIVPWNYNCHRKFEPSNEQENNEVCFKNTIKPGQTFNVRMNMNKNSLIQDNSDGTSTYGWHCDVVSQVVLNRRASILYTLMIGDNLRQMRRMNRSALTALSKGDFTQVFEFDSAKARDLQDSDEPGDDPHERREAKSGLDAAGLVVVCSTTDEIWDPNPVYPSKPIHLVIITHGIFSNLTADMLFLRDAIMSLNSSSNNFLVGGFRGNAGRTEKGIHRLGVGVAGYTVKLIEGLEKKGYQIRDISFLGHSLGGPVQLYALKHILETESLDFFKRKNINLKHFVCMASPMLGILSEMSLLILWFLDLGTLGKTGRDLTLLKKLPNIRKDSRKHGPHWEFHSVRPLLETLPDEPVSSLLKEFHLRTVYANAINDGIVPLRTSALLYLDWEALGNIQELKDENRTKGGNTEKEEPSASAENGDLEENVDERGSKENVDKPKDVVDAFNVDGSSNVAAEDGEKVGQVPEDLNANVTEKYTTFLARIFNFDFENPSKKQPPHKRRRIRNRIKRYAKINVKSSDLPTSHPKQDASSSRKNDTDYVESEEVSGDETYDSNAFNIPPKASAVESALNSMICPIPSRDYINDPSSRPSVIFHDRYYHFKHVPEENLRTGNFNKFFRYHDWRMDKQVKIAAKYHGPKLSWRKVLVNLPPDAHNNIVVRRRFANGYGWGVVDHLRNHIFTEDLKAKY